MWVAEKMRDEIKGKLWEWLGPRCVFILFHHIMWRFLLFEREKIFLPGTRRQVTAKCGQVNRLAERQAGRQATDRKSEQTRCFTAETDKGYIQPANLQTQVGLKLMADAFVCAWSVMQPTSHTKRHVNKKWVITTKLHISCCILLILTWWCVPWASLLLFTYFNALSICP